ncbi:hypothetical protein [Burkholderia metallica]
MSVNQSRANDRAARTRPVAEPLIPEHGFRAEHNMSSPWYKNRVENRGGPVVYIHAGTSAAFLMLPVAACLGFSGWETGQRFHQPMMDVPGHPLLMFTQN